MSNQKPKDDGDSVQGLANWLGIDLHLGTDPYVRTDPQETVSSNQADEKGISQGSSGGCTQNAENVPSKK